MIICVRLVLAWTDNDVHIIVYSQTYAGLAHVGGPALIGVRGGAGRQRILRVGNKWKQLQQ
jgi:hypothetical protein